LKSVCVFCGSNTGKDEVYRSAAKSLGEAIVRRGLRLVYGGGRIGLMGVLGEAALAANGHVIGVTPQRLLDRELVHGGLSELHVVNSMNERKTLMAELSDAFIALPGGMGTLDEMFEMLTWNQLGFHRKPCGLLDAGNYYEHLMAFLDHSVAERFVTPEHRHMLMIEQDPDRLLSRLASEPPPEVGKWLDPTAPGR